MLGKSYAISLLANLNARTEGSSSRQTTRRQSSSTPSRQTLSLGSGGKKKLNFIGSNNGHRRGQSGGTGHPYAFTSSGGAIGSPTKSNRGLDTSINSIRVNVDEIVMMDGNESVGDYPVVSDSVERSISRLNDLHAR